MNIKFKNLKLSNFFSFDKAEIDLSSSGYILVSGVNNNQDDMAKSNGSGKSSIWEAIIWNLTGDTIRGTKQVTNRLTDGGTSVELIFNIDKDEYKIIRYKDHKEFGSNLKIFINNEDKSGKGIRDSEKLLEQYLPDLTASLLGSVIILGQGLPQRFTNNTPAGRKEVLEKLSKSDFMIEDIKNKLTKRKTQLNEQLRTFEDLILSDESKVNVHKNNLKSYQEKYSQINIDIDYDNELDKLNEDLNTIIIDYNVHEKWIQEENNKLDIAKEEYLKLETLINNKESLIYNEFISKKSELSIKKNEYDINIKTLKDEINKFESVKDICPTCGQKLPDVHKIDTTELRIKLENLNIEKDKFINQISQLEEQNTLDHKAIQQEFKETKENQLNEINNIKSKLNSLNDALKQLNVHKNNLELKIKEVNLEKESHKNKLEELKSNIKATEDLIDELCKKVLYNNIEKDNIKSHLEIVNKMLTIATRDFRGFLLSEIINFINTKAKEYSQEIFETDKIDFKLEGNNINISYCDKQYENLSGGEKQKIDLIIQFSIRDMLSQFLNFSSNILVLDEIFDNLDNIGCQRVLNLISNKLTDIDGMYIITHHTDIDIPYDHELFIVKDVNGISRIQ